MPHIPLVIQNGYEFLRLKYALSKMFKVADDDWSCGLELRLSPLGMSYINRPVGIYTNWYSNVDRSFHLILFSLECRVSF